MRGNYHKAGYQKNARQDKSSRDSRIFFEIIAEIGKSQGQKRQKSSRGLNVIFGAHGFGSNNNRYSKSGKKNKKHFFFLCKTKLDIFALFKKQGKERYKKQWRQIDKKCQNKIEYIVNPKAERKTQEFFWR